MYYILQWALGMHGIHRKQKFSVSRALHSGHYWRRSKPFPIICFIFIIHLWSFWGTSRWFGQSFVVSTCTKWQIKWILSRKLYKILIFLEKTLLKIYEGENLKVSNWYHNSVHGSKAIEFLTLEKKTKSEWKIVKEWNSNLRVFHPQPWVSEIADILQCLQWSPEELLIFLYIAKWVLSQ